MRRWSSGSRNERLGGRRLQYGFLMAEVDARVRQLKNFLVRRETEISGMTAPCPERAAVRVQVREQLAAESPVEEVLPRCLGM